MNIAVSGLTGAVAVAPAAASALCRLPAEGEDAELQALGEKLKPLVAEITAARAIDRQHMEDWNAKLAAAGLKDEEEYPDSSAYMNERSRLCDLLCENEDNAYIGPDFDGIHNRIFTLLDDILALRARTVQGFAVQVLAIVTAHDDLCYDSDETLELPYGVIEFFCRTCEFVGVPIPAA